MPTKQPSNQPTAKPTTISPTQQPTQIPSSGSPITIPTSQPTNKPSSGPTPAPTNEPTPSPSDVPTSAPVEIPTHAPIQSPTKSPTTKKPTQAPTKDIQTTNCINQIDCTNKTIVCGGDECSVYCLGNVHICLSIFFLNENMEIFAVCIFFFAKMFFCFGAKNIMFFLKNLSLENVLFFHFCVFV